MRIGKLDIIGPTLMTLRIYGEQFCSELRRFAESLPVENVTVILQRLQPFGLRYRLAHLLNRPVYIPSKSKTLEFEALAAHGGSNNKLKALALRPGFDAEGKTALKAALKRAIDLAF